MPPSAPSRLDPALRAATGALAFAFVTAFATVAVLRLGFPYELEWMGGAFVDHVARVLDGQSIYVPPSTDFVPFLYTPLYYWVGAAWSAVCGLGFTALRLASLSATLVTLAVTWWVLRRHAGRLPALVATGVFAGCYGQVDSWYDLARVDSLFVALLAVTLALAWRGRGVPSAIAAGAVLTLGYLTKQSALIAAPPFAIAIAFASADPLPARLRRAGAFVLAFTATLLGAVTALDWAHDGWFSFYTWTLPRRHEYELGLLATFARDLVPLSPALLLGGTWLVRLATTGRIRELCFHGAWSGGLLLIACLSRLHVGGAENVLIPGLLALAWVTGLGLRELTAAPVRWSRLAAVAALAQLALLVYDPRGYVPTERDRVAGAELLEVLRSTRGEVLVPMHGHLARMAGKRTGAHALAVIDVVRGAEDHPLCEELGLAFWALGARPDLELVVLDEPGFGDFARLVGKGYRVERLLGDGDPDYLMPVAGLQTRPNVLFRRLRSGN